MATATAALKRMYIDGKWCAADNGRTLGVINPATEEVIEEIAYGGRAEVRRAIEAAHRAMPGECIGADPFPPSSTSTGTPSIAARRVSSRTPAVDPASTCVRGPSYAAMCRRPGAPSA